MAQLTMLIRRENYCRLWTSTRRAFKLAAGRIRFDLSPGDSVFFRIYFFKQEI